MFDLVDECGKDLKEYGYSVKSEGCYNITTASLLIESEEKSKKLGLDKGEYFIVNSPNLYDYGLECGHYVTKLLTKFLRKIAKGLNISNKSKVLIACLGNPDVTADRLGKAVFDEIKIDAFSKENNIFKFCPNIYFSTGIETIDMVKMLVREKNVEFVFIIDSLTTNAISRLGTSFQITTNGMTPGSGFNRFGKRINKESVNAVCLSFGVPFMIFASDLNKKSPEDLVLAPKDIKENVEFAGFIIASAINEVLKWTIIYWYHFL